MEDDVRNRDQSQEWIDQWYPLAARAVQTFTSLFDESLGQNEMTPHQLAAEAIDQYYRDYLRSMNLELAS